MSYILSTDNRFYVALEQSYGNAGAVASANRIPALKLTAKQRTEKVQRKDKTGSRTFAGYPSGLRRETSFELRTYMTTWADTTGQPPYGPLFEACMGAPALQWNGGTIASAPNPSQITFAAPHGLVPGQAVTSGGEIRFVSALVDDQTVQLNAPLSAPPSATSQTGPTVIYQLATNLKSITLFDYWSPGTSVQRIVSGGAVDAMSVIVNGDFHEFRFAGQARDLVDNSTFETGQCGLSSYPPEPAVEALNYSIIPGHLGQVWLGSSPDRFLTLTKAEVSFQNNIDLRAREFGLDLATAISPGLRQATIDFSLYQQDDAATAALYQAARQQSPISVMIQLGQQEGQLFAIYMKSVIPEVPEFDDSERRQQWQFQNCRAQGSIDDEIIVAFG
jgi:hypothetical protein